MRRSGIIDALFGVACALCALVQTNAVMASDRVPVKWARSIYAPSYGLDDDRVVARQSEFVDLYERWLPAVQFRLHLNESNKIRPVAFDSGKQFLEFDAPSKNSGWENDLERLRYWMQVSSCKMWKMMPELTGSSVSYLPDLIDGNESRLGEAKVFSKELIRKIFQEKKIFESDLLFDLDLVDELDMDCPITSECGYVVADDGFKSLSIDLVAQGDYNKDGINDFIVRISSVGDPFKKDVYIGVILTRKTRNGPLEIIGNY